MRKTRKDGTERGGKCQIDQGLEAEEEEEEEAEEEAEEEEKAEEEEGVAEEAEEAEEEAGGKFPIEIKTQIVFAWVISSANFEDFMNNTYKKAPDGLCAI